MTSRGRRPDGCYHSGAEDTRISDRPPSGETSTQAARGTAAPANPRRLGLISFLVELTLPVALASALLFIVAGQVSFWNLRSAAGLAVFGLLLVMLSLLLSVKIDGFTLARRQKLGKRQILNRANPRARLAKFILGGLLMPLAALVAATRVELPGHRTPMELAIEAGTSVPTVSAAARLGAAVLRAPSSAARQQGVAALQALGSEEALDQLLHIVGDDPAALQDGGLSRALGKAVASFGARATRKLIARFNQVGAGERRSAAAPPGDLFERCFAGGFESLADEVNRRTPEPAARAAAIARLEAARAELRRAVDGVESDTQPAATAASLPAFIMAAFLEMDLKHDSELLAFARTVAADAGWSDAVRGLALLLTAKLGASDDLPALYAHLDDSSSLLQARTMQAIAILQAKLAAAGK